MKEFVISSKEAGQRMDKYLFKVLAQAPKSFVYRMLRKKNIVLNGKKAAGQEILKEKDAIQIYFSDETFEKFSASRKEDLPPASGRQRHPISPAIVYEDADILIINKPAGLLSQKAAASDYSANEMIIDYLLESGQLSREELRTFRPSVCNRLDRNTSGLLIAGKTMRGLQEMSSQLKSRSLQKYYRCLVWGQVCGEAHLAGYLLKNRRTNEVTVFRSKEEIPDCGKNGEKPAPIETEYRPVRRHGNVTLLEVHLITGRSHQIRAHLASVGYPLIGDAKYGNREVNERFRREAGVNGQLLHAYRMEFADGKTILADEPEVFEKVLRMG